MDQAQPITHQHPTLRPGVAALILANVIPLVGVLFMGWSLFAVVFLYWVENIVVGLFNVLRMSKARGPIPAGEVPKINNMPYTPGARFFLILFFLVHYGIFTFVHGMFVFLLFGPFDLPPSTFALAIIALVFSHGISYATNFIGRGEYQRVHETTLFMQPYKRIGILHVSIIAGAFIIQLIGVPLAALVVFILLKTTVDVWAHVREHEGFAVGG